MRSREPILSKRSLELSVVVTGSVEGYTRDSAVGGHHLAAARSLAPYRRRRASSLSAIPQDRSTTGPWSSKVPVLNGAEAFEVLHERGPGAARRVATVGE